MGRALRELLQECRSVFDEFANVVYVVFLHRDPFEATTERPTRHSVGIVADALQDVGMNHPRAADFDPARAAACPAPAAAAARTRHVNLGTWFGKGKE